MDGQTLRDAQAPLKQRYRDEAAAATVTLVADGSLDGTDLTWSVRTGRALVEAGLHSATGGDGSAACSGDMLLQALVACAGVTLRALATSMGLQLAGGSVRTEGDLDFRGTLGVDKQAPVGFSDIRLHLELAGADLDDEQRGTLLRLTERYCVVLQTLRTAPPTTATIS